MTGAREALVLEAQALRKELRKTRRIRRWLIVVGVPLATGALLFGFVLDPAAASVTFVGTIIALKVCDLISVRVPEDPVDPPEEWGG